jgi:hypothetical protein
MGICLLEWITWRRLKRMRRADEPAFLSTALAVLLVNSILAIDSQTDMFTNSNDLPNKLYP